MWHSKLIWYHRGNVNLYDCYQSNREFAYTSQRDNLKSLTLNSGKIVDFIQTFGPLVSCFALSDIGFMHVR